MSVKSKAPATIAVQSRLAKEAANMKIDVVKAAEHGIKQAIQAEKERLWRLENAQSIKASNAYVDQHGLPFGSFRTF
ncbi:MAG: type II toxin-antitoxin system CcdA family antitoxin [Roseibium sp.]|nr:type II toxin-antitoxin system CcdA family antitoxin [Roseibium sp.]